jgi:arylsulfatase A-like enzyme
MTFPKILLIITDEERYPRRHETEAVAEFRREQLCARKSWRHRHDAGSRARTRTRATLFTGQYPSLRGVAQTRSTSKKDEDHAMMWFDPDSVPTLRRNG